MKDTSIKSPKVGYNSAKEGLNTPFLNLVGGVNVSIIPHGDMDAQLMMSIEALRQSDRYMDALTQEVGGCQVLVLTMTAHVKRRIN